MIGIADPDRAETALAAGALACPGCTRPLRPWGHAHTRTVRDHGTTVLALRPRRARCRTCRVTHVLLPAAATPRHADSTAVIGSALLASARGTGYRRIAAELDRPLSTVRRWVRAVRDPGHLEWLRRQGVECWPWSTVMSGRVAAGHQQPRHQLHRHKGPRAAALVLTVGLTTPGRKCRAGMSQGVLDAPDPTMRRSERAPPST